MLIYRANISKIFHGISDFEPQADHKLENGRNLIPAIFIVYIGQGVYLPCIQTVFAMYTDCICHVYRLYLPQIQTVLTANTNFIPPSVVNNE